MGRAGRVEGEQVAPADAAGATRGFGILGLENVCCEFGTVRALRGLTLTIGRGEFIALLGPSGCGKSTALNCIAGLETPSEGTIRLDGMRINERGPEDRNFGMVFQNYALFPHLTVRRNVSFGLETKGLAKAEIARRVDEALALVRLSDQGEKRPSQLSGGQQQRVAIARAIVPTPALVLMDEPLSNLDAKLRLEMRAEIRRIHGALGSTTIYVTHDHEEALSLADRVVVLGAGSVRQVGPPEEVYTRPASAEVADFMGYRNLLRVTVERRGGQIMARIGAASLPATTAEAIGERAVAAIRPDDLVATGDGPLDAMVETVEYRGRDYGCLARTGDGIALYFRTVTRLEPGSAVRLGADPARVLLFRDDTA